MHKQLTVWLTAIMLVIGSTAATADRKGHRHYKPGRGHYHEQRDNYRRWQSPRHRVIQIHQHYRRDYPGHFGAALLGSAITYALLHQHNGALCRDSHGHRDTRESRGRYSNRHPLVNCHRIERFADGSERRTRVPLAQCR